jgi:hypothetical protein
LSILKLFSTSSPLHAKHTQALAGPVDPEWGRSKCPRTDLNWATDLESSKKIANA